MKLTLHDQSFPLTPLALSASASLLSTPQFPQTLQIPLDRQAKIEHEKKQKQKDLLNASQQKREHPLLHAPVRFEPVCVTSLSALFLSPLDEFEGSELVSEMICRS